MRFCSRVFRYISEAHLEPNVFIPLTRTHASDRELTIYVKGFLSPNESPKDFHAFHNSHRKLVTERGWSPRCYGYQWESGSLSLTVPLSNFNLPIPIVTVGHILYSLYSKGSTGFASRKWSNIFILFCRQNFQDWFSDYRIWSDRCWTHCVCGAGAASILHCTAWSHVTCRSVFCQIEANSFALHTSQNCWPFVGVCYACWNSEIIVRGRVVAARGASACSSW